MDEECLGVVALFRVEGTPDAGLGGEDFFIRMLGGEGGLGDLIDLNDGTDFEVVANISDVELGLAVGIGGGGDVLPVEIDGVREADFGAGVAGGVDGEDAGLAAGVVQGPEDAGVALAAGEAGAFIDALVGELGDALGAGRDGGVFLQRGGTEA